MNQPSSGAMRTSLIGAPTTPLDYRVAEDIVLIEIEIAAFEGCEEACIHGRAAHFGAEHRRGGERRQSE